MNLAVSAERIVPEAPGTGEFGAAPTRRRARVGLALGGGAARGWSHIGVLRVLEEAGIVPDVVAGCSIGAIVGGTYAAGKLDELEAFARALSKRRVMGLLDFHIGGSGLIAGERLRRLFERDIAETRIEDLARTFVTVATELGTGHEIWLSRGPLIEAMRASYALPGIFGPVKVGGRWLMDGALVNPVPVTAARALGADVVICVNLNGDLKVRGTVIQTQDPDGGDAIVGAAAAAVEIVPAAGGSRWDRRWDLMASVRGAADRMRAGRARRAIGAPGIAGVMIDAFNITQDRISRSRLAGDPPDAMICPKLAAIGIFEFHRAEECIALGRQATERALPELRDVIAAIASYA